VHRVAHLRVVECREAERVLGARLLNWTSNLLPVTNFRDITEVNTPFLQVVATLMSARSPLTCMIM
jgi:hypothetical protein